MSTRMFLQLPGIEGDSTDRDHRGWIDIQHLTWALNNQGAGREGVGIPSLSDITMQRFMDRASVKLAFNCAGCTVF